MANRRDSRIEPSFEGSPRANSSDGFSVSEEDRVVPGNRKSAAGRRSAKAKSRRGRDRNRRGLVSIFARLLYWCFVFCIWGGIAAAGIVVYYGAKMPAATTWSIPDRAPNIKIVSVDGELIANRGMSGGEAVGLNEMSPYIPEAVVAIEDRRFYSHFGIDPIGLSRAMVTNVLGGHFAQGGSTLTQQLAKNLFLTPDRTLERKVQEVLLALWLEHKHSKDQILEMYLNRVYFGSGAYGVEAASRRYFGKSARDVTLSEAALLAGLLKAPSRLSPARDPKAAEERAQLVLAAMRQEGKIGDKEYKMALSAPATRAPSYWTGSENYVADTVMEELPDLIGDVRGDIVIDTTVDLTLQKLAEQSIRRLIDESGKKLNVTQGALVSIDDSGAVRAMVGGYDYSTSQFDRASEARRQPGSAFKPFVYMAALEAGRTPDSVRNDAPIKIGKWTPENYGGKYYGKVTLATALAKSLNSVAAQLTMEVGPDAVVEAAHRMGIQSDLQSNTSIALGTSEVTPLELTAAYVPFANGGYKPDIYFIRRITTGDGKVLYDNNGGGAPRVIKADVVGMMNSMMTGTVEIGTAKKAAFNWPSAGKTGTSQNSRDAWFVGYTANLTTGVWFGNDDGSPMKKVTGGALPAQAWHEFMVAAHEGVPVRPLPGTWKSTPSQTIVPDEIPSADASQPPPAPPAPVGQSTPVAKAQVRQARPAQTVDADGFDMPGDGGTTASVGHPVPPGDVGGPTKKRNTSILDILSGG
ncbi:MULTISPECIES: transglycosylase domain-containing protein [unclassified Mesorhizobium]|uniref:transglycosylase domain-containing protein n=2 Tax=Mesorhizobium TaxID=68287 RepID=UPI000BAF5AD2|nr:MULTISPECIES: transglycosylase domain-containing protein [unclassified Mesorhizobium]TGT63453.1 penicillin-binding protein [Mesorhizobium sp. M00.F.Ca.ET.170.01.1.1]PBB88276.1 penicillin-binding protein [Mesorhizobium sp. WSM3876]RWB76781.1 MAG: penicillin-binding protein [Mesorhizobium sp.]RWB92042.1 MAG: penicillin-binding protein [Mesorhizobium sp.]RWE25526.1 MAG: penicillin-binding protein [Mesorhizobium sp.]